MKNIFTLAVLVLWVAMTAASQPSWFSNPTGAGYPSIQYIVGTGSGSTAGAALIAAQQAIASQLRVSIESKIESFKQEIRTNDKSEVLDQIKNSTSTVVNETVTGIQIAKQEGNGGTTYVLAVLDKDKYLRGLRSDLDNLSEKISDLIQKGKAALKEGKTFAGLDMMLDAQESLNVFYPKRAFYDALSNFPYVWIEIEEASDLMPTIRNILSDIHIEVSQGDKQAAKAGLMLPSPIQFKATVKFDNRRIPIQRLPVIISYDDGTLIERGITNDDGTIELWVKALASSGEKGKVTALLNPYRLSALYRKYVNDAIASASFTATSIAPMAFSLAVKDEQGARVFDVEKKFVTAVEKLNHRVGDKANLMLEGVIKKSDVKQIDGMKGPQYLTTCEVTMFLSIKITREKIGSFSSTAQGLADNEEKSLKAAYGKLTISPKDFTEMLSKSEDGLNKTFDTISADAMKAGRAKYAQGQLENAIAELVNVIYDDARVAEASTFTDKIRAEINRKEEERIAREERQKRMEIQGEIEKVRLYAEAKTAVANANVEIENIRAGKKRKVPSWIIGTWILPDSQFELRLNSDNSASLQKDGRKQVGKFDTTADNIILDMGVDGITNLRFISAEKVIIDQSGKALQKK